MQDYPEQYKTLIDDETWAFIRRTESFYPADSVESSIEEQRRVYNLMCDAFAAPYPDNVTAQDSLLTVSDKCAPKSNSVDDEEPLVTLPQRHYQTSKGKTDSAIVYFHGGGFVVGDLDSHDSICAELCARTGLDVIATDYRLLPEHPALAAYFDALAAYEDIAKRYKSVVLCGDSAGANLCAAVTHTDRNRNGADSSATHAILRGQVLIYPGLGASLSSGSAITHSDAPMLTLADVQFYDTLRNTRTDNDYRLAPLLDKNFKSLPRTICLGAECDPLADDGRFYCEKIEAAGGKAEYILEPGLVHGYLRARHSVARAQASFSRVCEAIASLV